MVPLQPHHDAHPLDGPHLHVSANRYMYPGGESGRQNLSGTDIHVADASTRTTQRHGNGGQLKATQDTQCRANGQNEDVAALISENHELRQQTMELKLQLADALAKIDELMQQNRQLSKLHEQQMKTCTPNTAQEEMSHPNNACSDTYHDYTEEMKPPKEISPLRPSLVGPASIRNMFSSLRGEAEVTNASSAVSSKRSSIASMGRSSCYNYRSSQSRDGSQSSISTTGLSSGARNDDSSQSISLHPDDLGRIGDQSNPSIRHHVCGSALLESMPEEKAVASSQNIAATRNSASKLVTDGGKRPVATRSASWLQHLGGSLSVLNLGESAGLARMMDEEDDGDDDGKSTDISETKNRRRMPRRCSSSEPNLAAAEQEREKLAQSISPSTLSQLHGSMLDLMALAPSKLAEVTMEKEEEQHIIEPRPVSIGSVQHTTNRNHGKPLNAGDHFEVPLRAEKSNAGAAEGEDGGMKRNNTDKDVNDFFRRMSGAMSDDESDAGDLAGGGGNAIWNDLAGHAKRLSPGSNTSTKNDFAAMADKLIADSTFDLYK